jgi:hypothetical protein
MLTGAARLEEGAWGRNLAKVSLPLARLTHIMTLPQLSRHVRIRAFVPTPPQAHALTKKQRQEIAREAAAAGWVRQNKAPRDNLKTHVVFPRGEYVSGLGEFRRFGTSLPVFPGLFIPMWV